MDVPGSRYLPSGGGLLFLDRAPTIIFVNYDGSWLLEFHQSALIPGALGGRAEARDDPIHARSQPVIYSGRCQTEEFPIRAEPVDCSAACARGPERNAGVSSTSAIARSDIQFTPWAARCAGTNWSR